MRAACLFLCLCLPMPTWAQSVIDDTDYLTEERPEAWAMHYFTATSLMTAFGPIPHLAPGRWQVAAELGEVLHLDADQRSVGFNGTKAEDLNKSPVFGRVRGWIGLPGGFVAELGWTPPLTIDGARPRDIFAAAVGRRVVDAYGYTVSLRAFGQHGAVTGDITCPAALAGVQDFVLNPYGCEAPSRDTLQANYYGLEATFAHMGGAWTWHATGGLVRMENEVQVDALTYGFRDRSRLVSRDDVPYLAAGLGYDLSPSWHVGAEVLYVPLMVLRDPNGSSDNDPLLSFRLQLAYRFNGR